MDGTMGAPERGLDDEDGAQGRPAWPPLGRIVAVSSGIGAVLAAWVWGFALPSAPDEVWVWFHPDLDPKPHAAAYFTPGGTPVGLAGWFEDPDGGSPGVWDESLQVRLEAETPFLRKAVVSFASGGNATWSAVARYRFTGEVQNLARGPWARYVLDD